MCNEKIQCGCCLWVSKRTSKLAPLRTKHVNKTQRKTLHFGKQSQKSRSTKNDTNLKLVAAASSLDSFAPKESPRAVALILTGQALEVWKGKAQSMPRWWWRPIWRLKRKRRTHRYLSGHRRNSLLLFDCKGFLQCWSTPSTPFKLSANFVYLIYIQQTQCSHISFLLACTK